MIMSCCLSYLTCCHACLTCETYCRHVFLLMSARTARTAAALKLPAPTQWALTPEDHAIAQAQVCMHLHFIHAYACQNDIIAQYRHTHQHDLTAQLSIRAGSSNCHMCLQQRFHGQGCVWWVQAVQDVEKYVLHSVCFSFIIQRDHLLYYT